MASLELKARLDTLLSTAQAETADIDLFATIDIQEREECPICMIPLPCCIYAMLWEANMYGMHFQGSQFRESKTRN